MKLLTKSEVAKAQADVKKQEIDEGLKLARKVDNLREIKAQEEASLEKFRRETVSKINTEISLLDTKKSEVLKEVSTLEKARKKLMEPLDDEWKKIHVANLAIGEKVQNLNEKESLILKREKETRIAFKETNNLLAKTILKDERAAELLLKADRKSTQANTVLKNAKEIEAKALSFKKEVEKELVERDIQAAVRERSLDMRDINLKKKESSLEKEWELLEDRKAMVERRIKNKK